MFLHIPKFDDIIHKIADKIKIFSKISLIIFVFVL